MTTLILHGGATSQDNKQNDYFFSCFSKFVNKSEVKILLCYFSREKSKQDKIIKRDKPKIIRNSSKRLNFQIAKDAKHLLERIDDCDVLYVAGGKADLLEPYYERLEGLRDKLQDKVYIGSSMGAYMVSESYLTMQDKATHYGMGILPIQTICHWDQKKNKEQKLALLKNNSNAMILVLDEYQTVEIYK
ncbi:MAG: Type 1 glutamine amidotransferase-like domain-containing protein [Patescibacteria group bacterium]|nr:Type 1 glutamine amidotransferase-like domain-containing protein [Patescibacteria group bacterium]